MIGASEIILILYVPVVVFVIIFCLWMLIDCLKRQDDMFKFGGNHARLIWVMVLIFTGFIGFGTLIYYFLIKRTDPHQDRLIGIALLTSLVIIVFLIASGFTITETASSIEAYPSNKLPQYAPTVTMNGTFKIVNIPACPFNVQCNPKYQLAVEDGNTYQLLFGSGTRLPDGGQLIEVTGIVTYDTASECWLNDKKVPCQPTGRVNVSSWQPLLYDAQGYASATGVSIEEALRRMQLQDIAGRLEAELSKNETATFAGLWIEHTPEFRVIVAFTRDGEGTIKSYLKQHAELANIVNARTAKVSLANLQRDQANASSSVSASGIPVQSGIDVSENSVKLYVAKSDKSRFDAALEKGEIRLPDTVRVITVEALAEEYRDASSSPTAQASPEAPGFEAVLASLGLLAVWRMLMRYE